MTATRRWRRVDRCPSGPAGRDDAPGLHLVDGGRGRSARDRGAGARRAGRRGPGRAARPTPDWAALRGRIRGEAVTADAPDFLAARDGMVWNALKPDRSPDVIVRVKDEQDVVEAVNFAA